MLPHLEAILAHLGNLGAMFPISGTYVGSSCGYVGHCVLTVVELLF